MKYVALLRGVNVGGRVVKMDEVRHLFESLGYSEVSTVLQSGNVVFTSSTSEVDLADEIAVALTEAFDYPAKVLVRSIAFVQQVAANYPFEASDASKQNYVIFFEGGLEEALAEDAKDLDSTVDRIEVAAGVLYWQVAKGMTLKSELAKLLTLAKYRDFHTNRNMNTLQKIIHGSM